MSATNAFSLLNETEGSDTSYRCIHVSCPIYLLPEMDWTVTLEEDFAKKEEVEEMEVIIEDKPTVIVEEKSIKKNKKAKKVQPKVIDEDIDAILKEMGIEENVEAASVMESKDAKNESGKKKTQKKDISKAASIIANEAAQRRNLKKKGKK